MEATSIQEQSHEVHNSLHSSQFLIESSPLEFQDGINRQQTGKCGHFSIRGYVSETRKKDWRNNWPFFLPEETSKLELCKNILPPLLAIDSRWWCCPNCTQRSTSETEVVPVSCLGETSMPNDYLRKETFLLPYYNDHSAQSISECVKVSAEHNSSGLDMIPYISTENNKMGEAGLHLSGREASNGAIETCATSPDYQIQEEILDKISNEIVHEVTEAEICKKGVSKKTSEVAISLDLNKPAWDSSSDEIESGVSPVELELEASKVWCRSITHESNDVGFLNLNEDIVVASCNDSYKCHEDSRKSSKMGIPSSVNNGMPELAQKDKLYGKPQEIGPGIKQISSPLACLNPVNVDTSRESDQEKDDYCPIENPVENESPCGTSNGRLKRKRTQKMRLLTDILKTTKDLAVSEENHVASAKVKNRKCIRETGVGNAEHFLTVSTRVQPWNVTNHEGNEETERTGTSAYNDEPEATAKSTSGRKKNKAASNMDDQSLILHGQGIYVGPKTSNGIAETGHLNIVRHHKKSMERKQQNKTQETEDIHPQRRNDTSKSGTVLYSQEHVSLPRNDDQGWRNTRILGEAAVDDIPMDIVELLAKNQIERRLHKFQQGIGNRSSKSGSDVMYAHRADPLCNNMRSSDRTVAFTSHRKFNDDIHRDIPRMENSTTSKGFSPWVQPRGKGYGLQNSIHNSGGGSNGGPINCMQFLEDCRKNQMASQYINGQVYHDGRMLAVGGTHYDTNKKSTDLRTRDHSAVGYVKTNLVPPRGGNGISALNTNSEIFSNLNYPSSKKENTCQKVVNPMDLSPNESISASDLLRLMQQGASSSALPIDGRERICEQPFFSNGCSHKFFELEAGASNCIGFPVSSQSFQRITQSQQMRNTFELFPPVGRSGTYSSALLGEQGRSSNLGQPFELRSGFESDMQNFTSKTRRLDKTKQFLSATKVVSPRPNKTGLTSDLLKHLSLSCTKESLPANKAESHINFVTDLPMRNRSVNEICILNKNPAEFSLPEDGNIYMIKGERLKPLKASSSKDDTDGRKRQRTAKFTSMRDH